MGRLIPAAAMSALFLAVGCGTQASPDLFTVKRSGSIPGADLTLLVNDAGTVSCNGGPPRTLPDPLLLEARALARDLAADADRPIPAIAPLNPIYTFRVKTGAGTAKWMDGAPGLPASFLKLAQFTRQVAKGTCGLPR